MSEFVHYAEKGAVKLDDVSAIYKSNRQNTYRIMFELLGRKVIWWEFGDTGEGKAERNAVFNSLIAGVSNPLSVEKDGLEWGE
ncbi:MAG: hypothetical protein COB24_08980 [Hyphomicrobiales bacterium]|nr:MAG: hypothetical protein COB24_08980 [Hyphomicrobiales bacterium]